MKDECEKARELTAAHPALPPSSRYCCSFAKVTELSSLMFNFTGFLQASAPPVSVGGEPVPDLPAGAPRPDAKDLSRQILRKHREVGDLIERLPPAPPGEAEQLDTLVRLQVSGAGRAGAAAGAGADGAARAGGEPGGGGAAGR